MSFLLPPLPPTFEAALRDVRAHGMAARRAAAERLGKADDDQRSAALAGLLALAEDKDARVRAEALSSLRSLPDASTLPVLLRHCDDPDPYVRELAAVALGAQRGAEVERTLQGLLEHEHAEVRFAALQGYAEMAARPEASIVLARLADEDPEVRAIAARCSRVLGARARDALLSALDDSSMEARAEAALSLCALADASTITAPALRGGAFIGVNGLGEALELPDLQLEALDAIGRLGVTSLRDHVAALASSLLKPRWLKAAAARALVRLGDDLGVAALREVLCGLRRDGRSYAAEVAGELGLVALVPELVQLAQRPRGADPQTVASALGALLPRDDRARRGLERLARRSDEAGATARAALGR